MEQLVSNHTIVSAIMISYALFVLWIIYQLPPNVGDERTSGGDYGEQASSEGAYGIEDQTTKVRVCDHGARQCEHGACRAYCHRCENPMPDLDRKAHIMTRNISSTEEGN